MGHGDDGDEGDWSRFLQGDDEAARKIEAKHGKVVLAYLLKLGTGPEEAKEIVHIVFYRTLIKRPRPNPKTLRAYLCTVARNLFLDEKRKKKARAEVGLEESGVEPVEEPRSIEHIHAREMINFLRSEPVRRLLTPQEYAVVLLFLKEYGRMEIAVELGIGRQAVRQHLYSARKKLREMLGGDEGSSRGGEA